MTHRNRKKQRKPPQKMQVMVRLAPEDFARLKATAEQEGRSLGGQVAHVLKEQLPKEEATA